MIGFQKTEMMELSLVGVSASWTAEQIETLRVQWAKGLVAREIGIMINKSRNAVIGKAHRLELETRATRAGAPRLPKTSSQTPKPKRSHKKKEDDPVVALAKKVGGRNAPVFYAAAAPIVEREPISIMELNLETCRAIVGKAPNGLATYCGADVFPGKSFCPGHCAIYFAPPRDRRRA